MVFSEPTRDRIGGSWLSLTPLLLPSLDSLPSVGIVSSFATFSVRLLHLAAVVATAVLPDDGHVFLEPLLWRGITRVTTVLSVKSSEEWYGSQLVNGETGQEGSRNVLAAMVSLAVGLVSLVSDGAEEPGRV